MILDSPTINIERTGDIEQKQFGATLSAKAFELIYAGLYPVPIRAIVRELSANAYDSHVAAGKADVPFELHLPTPLEPYFSVKDFGIGLTHEEVMGLYTTIFESTKSSSNDYVGALGVGSKSPFAYSDVFEVFCRYNGKIRSYTMYLDETRIPTCALVATEDTDEVNGIEVRIPVAPTDFRLYEQNSATQLKYFKVKPIIVGQSTFVFDQLPPQSMTGDDWVLLLREQKYYSFSSTRAPKIVAVQGPVAYQVEAGELEDHLDESVAKFLNKIDLIMYFDIGSFDFAANREEVRYSDRSKIALAKKVTKVYQDVVALVETDINSIPVSDKKWDMWCAVQDKLVSWFGDVDHGSKFVGSVSNAPLIVSYIAAKETGYTLPKDFPVGHNITVYAHKSTFNVGNDKLTRGKSLLSTKTSSSQSWIHTGMPIKFDPKAIFILDDVKTGSARRLSSIDPHKPINVNGRKITPRTAYVIRRLTPRDVAKLDKYPSLEEYDYDGELDKLMTALGNPTMVKLSEISNSPAKRVRYLTYYHYNGKQSYGGIRRPKVDWRTTQESTSDFEDYLDDVTTPHLYFQLERGTTVITHTGNVIGWEHRLYESNMEKIIKFINTINKTKYQWKEIMGVAGGALTKTKNHKMWINVFELLEQSIAQYSEQMEKYWMVLSTQQDPLRLNTLLLGKHGQNVIDRINKLDQNSNFKKMYSELVDAAAVVTPHLQTIEKILDLDKDTTNISKFMCKKTHRIDNKYLDQYKMLKIASTIDYNHLDILFDYITLIDKQK